MARTCPPDPVPNELQVRPLAIYGVEGHQSRSNDALFQPALPFSADPSVRSKQRTLVFFGGDIQNLSYLMDQNDAQIDSRKWCLEETALRLGKDFPHCHVVVIKPSRIVFDHISCFDNFVQSDFIGIPKYNYHYRALLHLEKLLKTISRLLRRMAPEVLFQLLLRTLREEKLQEKHKIENGSVRQFQHMSEEKKRLLITWQRSLRLHRYPLTLVAFSKGCVVLNQMLHEFHFARSLEPRHRDSGFIERIRHMYWLDSGNCGHRNAYLTSMGLLRTLADLGIKIHVHVSVYMIEDNKRRWIGKEYRKFVSSLLSLQANVVHFRHISSTCDLHAHFKVLFRFRSAVKRRLKNFNSLKVRRRKALPPEEAPAQDDTIRVRPRIRPNQESIGLCLVSSRDHPYLELQMVIRRPDSAHQSFTSRVPGHRLFLNARYRPTPSTSQMLATSDGPLVSAQTQSTSVQPRTSAQMPSTYAEPSTSAQTQLIFTQRRMSTQMSLTHAEPSTSAQTQSTPVQNPPSMNVWSSELLPINNQNQTVLLLNEIGFNLNSDAEGREHITTSFFEMYAPVITIPSERHPSRLHVYSTENEIYVPTVCSHYVVADLENKNGETSLHLSELSTEEPPVATDGLDPAASGAENASATLNPDDEVPDENDPDDEDNPDDSNMSGSASDTSRSDTDSPVSGQTSTVSVDSALYVPSSSDSVESSSSGTSSPDLGGTSPRLTLTGSSLVDAISDIRAFSARVSASAAADQTLLSGPTTRRSALFTQLAASQNRVDPIDYQSTPSDSRSIPSGSQLSPSDFQSTPFGSQSSPSGFQSTPSGSQSTSSGFQSTSFGSQSTPSGSQVASSSRDPVAPQTNTSKPRVRGMDDDDEAPRRYNLRKRVKRSYDENYTDE